MHLVDVKVTIVVDVIFQALALTTTAFAATAKDVAWSMAAVPPLYEAAIVAYIDTTFTWLVLPRIEVAATLLLVLQLECDGPSAATIARTGTNQQQKYDGYQQQFPELCNRLKVHYFCEKSLNN